MMKNGMMMVCGNSIEDIKNGVMAMEMAMRSGAVMGVGGGSLADIKNGMAMMEQMMGGGSCSCGCPCCDDEGEDIDEVLGEVMEILADLGMSEEDIDEVCEIIEDIIG